MTYSAVVMNVMDVTLVDFGPSMLLLKAKENIGNATAESPQLEINVAAAGGWHCSQKWAVL